jgi:hypothetical protein
VAPFSVRPARPVAGVNLRQRLGWAFFTHDVHVAAAKINVDDKGRYSATDAESEVHWS